MLPWAIDSNALGVQAVTFIRVTVTILMVPVLYYILFTVYSLTLHPLAKYPGPKIAAVTRLWHSYHLLSGTIVQALFEAHEKYGPVVRIAPDEVLFTSSQAWEDIYGFRSGKPEMTKDTPLYKGPRVPHTIVTADYEQHRLYRRLLSRGFSEAALREQEPIVQGKIDLLIRKLHIEAANGVTPEMTSWFNFFTFDLIGELAFGESFGCLESSSYHPWVAMIFEVMKFRGVSQAFGYYPSLFKILMSFVPRSLSETFATHKKLTHEKVQRRLERQVNYKDLTSNLFDPKYNLERYQIDGNCSTIIIAGSETTTAALSAVTYYLTQNLDARAKVVQEVRSCFSRADEINAISINKLKYLQACLNEAMRKFPPGPSVFPRRVPKGGDFISGNWIAGGTQVGISHFCANNSSRNFTDPERFIPERWLGDPAYENDDRHAMQVFSHGPRNCLGQNLAKMEMGLLSARLIWEFDWGLAPSSENWDKETPVYNTWGMKPLRILLTPVVH